MKQEVILVLDCGATNVRAIAVDRQGKIVARASTPNASDVAAENGAWHQWSLEAILQRFASCCQTPRGGARRLPHSRYYGHHLWRRRGAGR
nr:L-fuculokinase [Raoultella sp. NCTC 9187]